MSDEVTRAQERARHEANSARLAESRERAAFLRGKIEATVESWRYDPELLAEAERLAKVRGTDAASIMDQTIEAARKRYVPATAEPAPGAGAAVASAAVAKFRDLLK